MRTALSLIFLIMSTYTFGQEQKPLRIGIAGLTHTHVHWIFNSAREYPQHIKIVGISESNRELANRYLKQYRLESTLLYPSLEEMLDAVKPEAVTAFNSIIEHLAVVKACAPRKIHVMVEKPLAVSLSHAKEMEALANTHGIHLLTNYETTWYASHAEAIMVIGANKIGALRKIVVHDGHPGPKEIGVDKEFLEWLTDPLKNGGGALMDFGCYGANLVTWLMNGAKPESVFAVTQQIKPDVYPNVDDEATIILTYPKMQGIVQASWNWPYNRKDIEVYGETAYIKADKNSLAYRLGDNSEENLIVPELSPEFKDPFVYLSAVIQGRLTVNNTDLSSLPLNMTVMEILEAAKLSSQSGQIIHLKSIRSQPSKR